MTTRWQQHVAILAQVCFASFFSVGRLRASGHDKAWWMHQFRRRWRRKVLVFAQWLLVRVNGGLLRVHTCIFWAVSLVFRCHQRLHTLVVEDISPEEGLLV